MAVPEKWQLKGIITCIKLQLAQPKSEALNTSQQHLLGEEQPVSYYLLSCFQVLWGGESCRQEARAYFTQCTTPCRCKCFKFST